MNVCLQWTLNVLCIAVRYLFIAVYLSLSNFNTRYCSVKSSVWFQMLTISLNISMLNWNMLFILHTTILVFGVFTFNKHTLYTVVLHCTEICRIYYIQQFLYLGFSLLINIPCTVLYCTVLNYGGYTTYTNSYIWGFHS